MDEQEKRFLKDIGLTEEEDAPLLKLDPSELDYKAELVELWLQAEGVVGYEGTGVIPAVWRLVSVAQLERALRDHYHVRRVGNRVLFLPDYWL